MKLTKAQIQGLRELDAVHRDGWTWVRPQWLNGTAHERSAANFRSLMNLGLVEGEKANFYNKQGQWRWRITDAGRAALEASDDEA